MVEHSRSDRPSAESFAALVEAQGHQARIQRASVGDELVSEQVHVWLKGRPGVMVEATGLLSPSAAVEFVGSGPFGPSIFDASAYGSDWSILASVLGVAAVKAAVA